MKKLLSFIIPIIQCVLCINTSAQSPYGTQVGQTYYDLPSNVSGYNRCAFNNDDQSVSITWIQSITALAQPTFERGAGYNHFVNGTWQFGTEGDCRVNNACSGEYSGWPELVNFPTQIQNINGKDTLVSPEVILSHSGGLKINDRLQRASGSFSAPNKLLFDQDYCEIGSVGTWPRMVSSGNSMLHMIATQVGDDFAAPLLCTPHSSVDRVFLYSRSSNQGATWDIQNFVLPGLDGTTNYTEGRGDEYQIAARDNYVAIVAGGLDQPYIMWKSEDYGVTWNYTTIKDWDANNPEPDEIGAFAGADGKYTSDGSHAITIDENGTVHCFTGVYMSALEADGTWGGIRVFGNSGIWYWNDGTTGFCEPVYIADLVDYGTYNGSSYIPHAGGPIYSDDPSWDPFDGMAQGGAGSGGGTGYFMSQTSMPSVSVQGDNIYVAYSADVEGTVARAANVGEPEAVPFRDIYLVWSNDGGKSWSYELNVSSDIAGYDDGTYGTGIEEDVYPNLAREVGSDNKLHMTWNMDYKPGSDTRDDNGEFSSQYITYYGIDLSALSFSKKLDISDQIAFNTESLTSFGDTAIIIGDTLILELTGSNQTVAPIDPYIVNSVDLNNDGDSTFYLFPEVLTAYTINADVNNACGTTEEKLTVSMLGGPMVASILEDTLSICAGDPVTIQAYGSGQSGNYSYAWGVSGSGNTSSVTFTPASSQFVSVTISEGGSSDNDFVYINVEAPFVSSTADTSICPGESITLSALANGTLSWNNGVQNNVAFNPALSSAYTATATSPIGCKVSSTTNVTVLPLPNVATIQDTSICSGNSISLSGQGANSYSWNNGVTDGASFVPTSVNTYVVTGTNLEGCQNSDSVTVSINALPNVTTSFTDTIVCNGSSIVLSGQGADSYSWNNGIINGLLFTPTASNIYTVTGTDDNGCTNTASVNVNVSNAQVVTANFDVVINDLVVVLTNSSINGVNWEWTIDDLATFDDQNVEVAFASGGEYQICLEASNECFSNLKCTFITLQGTGISELNNEHVQIYPNPTKDFVMVNLKQLTDSNTSIEIYDLTSKKLFDSNLSLGINRLDLSNLPIGNYIYKILTPNQALSQGKLSITK